MKLIDEAERAIAHDAALAIGQLRQRAALDLDLARRKRVETAEQVQQRAFPRSRRADDRQRLPARDGEIDAAQYFGAQLSFAVGLGDDGGTQYRCNVRSHGNAGASTVTGSR
jgi:hypothetical protein